MEPNGEMLWSSRKKDYQGVLEGTPHCPQCRVACSPPCHTKALQLLLHLPTCHKPWDRFMSGMPQGKAALEGKHTASVPHKDQAVLPSCSKPCSCPTVTSSRAFSCTSICQQLR